MTLIATISVLGFGTSLVRDFQRFKGKEWTLISTARLGTATVGGLLGAGSPSLPSLHLLRLMGRAALSHHLLNLALQPPSLLLPVFVTVLLSAQLNAAFYIAWMVAGFVFIGPRSLAVVLYAISSREPSSVS